MQLLAGSRWKVSRGPKHTFPLRGILGEWKCNPLKGGNNVHVRFLSWVTG